MGPRHFQVSGAPELREAKTAISGCIHKEAATKKYPIPDGLIDLEECLSARFNYD